MLILLGVKVETMVIVGVITEARGRSNQGDHDERNNLHCTRYDIWGHEANTYRTPWDKIKERSEKWKQEKNKNPKSARYVVAHCNTTIENLCNTSFASWQDAKLLDTDASCHISFWRDFFKDFNTKIDGVVYFVDRSWIKPSGIGTVRLKLLGLSDMILHDVLYLSKLWRNLLSLVFIHKQWYLIHMFDGIMEIRRSSNNKVAMTGREDEKSLKLHKGSNKSRNFA